jgi:hypothetical protein
VGFLTSDNAIAIHGLLRGQLYFTLLYFICDIKTDNTALKNVGKFKRLGKAATDHNCIRLEIARNLNSGNVCPLHSAVQNCDSTGYIQWARNDN